MIDIKLKGFTPVIDGLVDEYGLITAAVYGIVYRYCQMENGYCNAALEKIGDRLGVSEKTIKRHLKTLCDDGYIEDLTPDIRNVPHKYIVTGKIKIEGDLNTKGSENWLDTESDQNEDGRTESPSRSDRESEHGRTESPLKKDSKKDNKKQLAELISFELASICKLDPQLVTNRLKKDLQQSAVKLSTRVGELDQVKNFEQWWYTYDWRGKRGDVPTPSQVCNEWPKYESHDQETVNANGGKVWVLDS